MAEETKTEQAVSGLRDAAVEAIREKAHAPHGELELPGGYLHQTEDGETDLFNVVRMREMTGYEEDILLDSKTVPEERIGRVLWRCVEEFRSESGGVLTEKNAIRKAVEALPAGDRLAMLLFLRSISVGDEYMFEVSCPGCGRSSRHTVLLSEVLAEAKPMQDPKVRQYDVSLPTGRVVTMKVMDAVSERVVTQALRRGQDVETARLKARVVSIDGERATVKDLKALATRDRNALRRAFETKEGGIETEVAVTCGACGREFVADIDIGQRDFFFPAE